MENILIDPITKEVIKGNEKISINLFVFNYKSLLDWFLFSNDWINPITNLRFTYEEVDTIIKKAFDDNYYSDFIMKDHFMIYNLISIKKFKKITGMQKKYNETINNINKKIELIREKYNDLNKSKSKKISQLNERLEILESNKVKKFNEFQTKFKKTMMI